MNDYPQRKHVVRLKNGNFVKYWRGGEFGPDDNQVRLVVETNLLADAIPIAEANFNSFFKPLGAELLEIEITAKIL